MPKTNPDTAFFVNYFTGGGTFFKDWQLEKLRSLSGAEEVEYLTAQNIREAWMRASHAVDPTGEITNQIGDRLINARTSREAIQDLASSLRQNTSIYVQRATSIFLEDLSALQTAKSLGQDISTITLGAHQLPSLTQRSISRKTLSPQMISDLERIEKMLGTKATVLERTRQGLGAELTFRFTGAKGIPAETYTSRGREFVNPFEITVPRVDPLNPAIVSHGATQQSRYIAGRYGVITAEGMLQQSFNHEEWVLNRAASELIPEIQSIQGITARRARSMLSEFNTKMLEPLEWIPNLPPDIFPAIEKYTGTRSNIMRLYTPEGTAISEFQYADLIRQGGARGAEGLIPFYPGASPTQIAHNVVYTRDVSEVFHLMPGAVDWGRRPIKALRRDFIPTAEALLNMRLNPRNTMFNWMAAQEAVEAPMYKIGYISSRFEPQLAGTGVNTEGQFLLSQRWARSRGVSALRQLDVASGQVVGLGGLIGEEGNQWLVNQKARKGTLLGYDPTGRPVSLPSDMTVLEAAAFRDKNKGDFVRVSALEDLGSLKVGKYEGATKGMGVEVAPGYISKVLSGVGIRNIGELDALITMDDLRKNRGLHYNQLFSSLWEFTRANMDSGRTSSRLSSNFANDPIKILSAINKEALQSGHFQHEYTLREAFRLARAGRLTAQQMGQVFGAVPEVFKMEYQNIGELGDIWRRTLLRAEGLSEEDIERVLTAPESRFAKGYWMKQRQFGLSPAEAREISRGIATGTGQLWLAALGGSGAGKMGTMEPRLFEMLGSPAFGELGPQLQAEFKERMMAAHPERLIEERELTRSLETLFAPGKEARGLSAAAISLKGLPAEGGLVNLPGVGDIYIPGTATTAALASYKTPTGKMITPDLARAYLGAAEAGVQFKAGKMEDKAYRKIIEDLQGEVMRARTLSVTGKGGLLRDKLPGSMSLTGLVRTGKLATADPRAIGITRPFAERMFEGMEQMYGSDALSALRRRFQEGEAIGGLIARQPVTGPYSVQYARFQLIPGTDPIAVFNEQVRKAGVMVRGQVEKLSSPIRLSPLTGMLADVDGDTMSAILVSPKMEQSLSSFAMDQNAMKEYEEYTIRSQILKPKAGAQAEISLRRAMGGAALKLGITEGGRLGRVSVQLQQARMGLLMGKGAALTRQENMRALGLLEWLEQVPIAAKHIAPGQEEMTLFTLDNIWDAMRRKDEGGLIREIENIMRNAGPEAQAALRGGLTMGLVEETGVRQVDIPGIQYRQAARNIMAAQGAMEAAGEGEVSMAVFRRMARGMKPTPTQTEALLRSGVREGPFAGLLSLAELPGAAPEGVLAGVSKRALALQNKLMAAGKSTIARYKPLLIGGGVALGIAGFLSEPTRMAPPGSSIPPSDINLKSGSGGANVGLNLNVHPEGSVSGRPTAPSPLEGANRARIAAPEVPGSSLSVDIRGTSQGNIPYNELADQIRSGLGGSASIRTSISDRRSSLTSQKISDILEES